MNLRQWRRWGCALALAAFGFTAARAPAARADGSDQPPAATDRVVKIGPQAVVIVNAHGDVRMYDDPALQSPACKSPRDCWGQALGALGVFGALVYEELTTNADQSGGGVQRSGGEP